MSLLRILAVTLVLGGAANAQLQIVRNTSSGPLNPAGFLVDPAGGPMVAETWTPSLDDAAFTPAPAPGSIYFVAITNGPAPVDIPFGATSILVSVAPPNPLVTLGPFPAGAGVTPVPVVVPADCGLAGGGFSTQAALIGPTGSIQFTNAIDIVVGQGPAALYSINSDVPTLTTLDPTTGATLSSVSITLPGWNLQWGNGLAKEPVTGRLFAVMRWVGGPAPPTGRAQSSKHPNRPNPGGTPGPVGAVGRILVTICPLSGEASLVGDLGDNFAAIAFDDFGTLWGVVGDGGTAPNNLYVINPADATKILITTLGNGMDGESLGYNPNDGLLYHGSGNLSFTGMPAILETIDPFQPTNPPVDIASFATSTVNTDETNAISRFDNSVGGFWWASGCCSIAGGPSGFVSALYIVAAAGTGTQVGILDHVSKGLATLP